MGAIINIVINILFIKRIGLYAAALSTAISYFVMMMYRHFDLKKYVNIKVEKTFIIKTLLIFTFSITLYYINNLYLNILNLIVVCIYAYLINKSFLKSSLNSILSKLKRK